MSRSDDVRALVERHFPWTPMSMPPLAVSPIGAEEVEAAIETLPSGWVTMGKKWPRLKRRGRTPWAPNTRSA